MKSEFALVKDEAGKVWAFSEVSHDTIGPLIVDGIIDYYGLYGIDGFEFSVRDTDEYGRNSDFILTDGETHKIVDCRELKQPMFEVIDTEFKQRTFPLNT